MEAFVVETGVERVRVKTFVPIRQWRSKLGTFPYATDGLVFVPATRESYEAEVKLKWKVVCVPGSKESCLLWRPLHTTHSQPSAFGC